MREIIFRGKRIDNGEWVEGLPFGSIYGGFSNGAICSIRKAAEKYGDVHSVVIETVGQYTGLTDKNGKKIFEGDLMAFRPLKGVVEVVWDGIGWKTFSRFLGGKIRLADATERDDINTMRTFEVIGNKWDNPELLEVKE